MQRLYRQMDWRATSARLRDAARTAGFRLAVAAIFVVSGVILSGGPASAQSDLGTWLNTDKKGKIELRKCGAEGLCSKIVWLKEPNDENGTPWRDILNPDPGKRGRPVIGIDVLQGLKKIGSNTWQGYIYDPEVGKIYYLKHLKIGENRVEIRGCLSSGWPCRTKYWTRTRPINPPAPVQVAAPRPAPKVQRKVQPPPPVAARPAPRPAVPPVQQQANVKPLPPAVRAPVLRPTPRPVQRQSAAQPPVAQPVQRQAVAQPPLPTARPPVSRPVAPWPAARATTPGQGMVARATPAPVRRPPVVTGSVPRPATVAPPDAPGYLVQVTAGQDQGEALRTFGKLQQLHPNLLGGYLPNIQKVNLGPKGVWYRVRVGPMIRRTAAVDFCQQLKAAGADCLIRRQ